jgi:hypothetical protein
MYGFSGCAQRPADFYQSISPVFCYFQKQEVKPSQIGMKYDRLVDKFL